MNTIIKKLSIFILLAAALGACKKEGYFGKDYTTDPLPDVRPAVSVTVPNAIDYRPEPTVGASKSAGGPIQIVLSIPAASGRTIKEITKVAANTTYTQIQGSGNTGYYVSTPIPVNSTTATFNTSLTAYVANAAGNVIPASNTELAKRFYFLLTLDDGSQVIPMAVRVLVLD